MPQIAYALHLHSTVPSSDQPETEARRAALRLYKDLAFDFVVNDLEMPLRLVEGVDAVVQNVFVRLRFFLGEWFLDQREGVPYFERILIHHPDPRNVESILRGVIQGTPGIARVANVEIAWDKVTRDFRLHGWTATLDDGSTVVWPRGPIEPFIVGQGKTNG